MTLRELTLLFQQRASEIKDRAVLLEQRDADIDEIAAAMRKIENERRVSHE